MQRIYTLSYPKVHPMSKNGCLCKKPDLRGSNLVLHIFHGLRHQGALAGETHLGSKGGVRNPLAGSAGVGLLEHAVDLLEREALGLRDEDVGVDEADGAEGAPDEEDFGAEVALVGADHIGGDDGDDLELGVSGVLRLMIGGWLTYAIPKPVGGGGESDAARTDGKGEDLADQHPRARTPCRGEEEDVDADEGNHHIDGCTGGGARGGTDNGNDELAHDHACSATDEERPAAEALDRPERDGRGAHVDESGDKRNEERVLDGAKLLEKGGTEVEDEVDTGPLLHHLQRCAEDGTAQVTAGRGQAPLEAIGP